MKTIQTKRMSGTFEDNYARATNRRIRRTPAVVRPNLVENEEYEWTSALSLPGLIVSKAVEEPPAATVVPTRQRGGIELVETEDGDATSACQLPGGLIPAAEPIAFREETLSKRSELEWGDEYTDRAAMQLPGCVVGPVDTTGEATAPAATKGLCATCLHLPTCNFPRAESGVWRCEEYE
jgi:hypothetical protein